MNHLLRFVRWFPRRLGRLFRHVPYGISQLARGGDVAFWWAEGLFYAADLLGIFDCYDGLVPVFKRNIRPLYAREELLARRVYGDTLDWSAVRVDDRARVACRRYRLCYVSFYTINSWGPMRDATLVHELLHVWQYERYGAVYIPRALRAQRSAMGYNYGGTATLRFLRQRGQTLHDFNYEQQADIVADAWRVQHDLPPRWGDRSDDAVYALYLDDLSKPIR